MTTFILDYTYWLDLTKKGLMNFYSNVLKLSPFFPYYRYLSYYAYPITEYLVAGISYICFYYSFTSLNFIISI